MSNCTRKFWLDMPFMPILLHVPIALEPWHMNNCFGFRVPGFGFRVADFVFRVSCFGFRVCIPGTGFRVPGSGVRVSGFGYQVSCSGVRFSFFVLGFSFYFFRFWYFMFRDSGSDQAEEHEEHAHEQPAPRRLHATANSLYKPHPL